MLHKQDMMEALVHAHGVQLEVVKSEVGELTKVTRCLVEKMDKLTSATELTRQLEQNGKGAVGLLKMVWKPLAYTLLTATFIYALVQYLSTGVWPEWYRAIWNFRP